MENKNALSHSPKVRLTTREMHEIFLTGREMVDPTEARRGSEKKQGQDEPIEKWLVWQGLIGWEKNLG